MPTREWLKQEFAYGYTSGNILAARPDDRRRGEERRIGGSYHYFFMKKVLPLLKPHFRVLELGPGGGDWSRALLAHLPEGELHTCDFQDVTPWLEPQRYQGCLYCHKVEENSFACVPDAYFDLFFSFGVLVHCNKALIAEILKNALQKMKPGGVALHNYGDWDKLTAWGWDRGTIPLQFQLLPDDDIWWPRNRGSEMAQIVTDAGWNVLCQDLGCFKRDGIIFLKRP